MSLADILDDLADLVEAAPARWATEEDIQLHLASLLESRGFVREHRLTPTERVDLWHPDGIAVEVKIKGHRAALFRQLLRYAHLDEVNGLLVVTSKPGMEPPGYELGGKPFSTARLWLWAFR